MPAAKIEPVTGSRWRVKTIPTFWPGGRARVEAPVSTGAPSRRACAWPRSLSRRPTRAAQDRRASAAPSSSRKASSSLSVVTGGDWSPRKRLASGGEVGEEGDIPAGLPLLPAVLEVVAPLAAEAQAPAGLGGRLGDQDPRELLVEEGLEGQLQRPQINALRLGPAVEPDPAALQVDVEPVEPLLLEDRLEEEGVERHLDAMTQSEGVGRLDVDDPQGEASLPVKPDRDQIRAAGREDDLRRVDPEPLVETRGGMKLGLVEPDLRVGLAQVLQEALVGEDPVREGLCPLPRAP